MKIILVGAGGSGISSIGLLLKKLGFDNIIGIDSSESQITQKLKDNGIEVIIGHGILLPEPEDFVIYSDAALKGPEVTKSLEYEGMGLKYYHKPYSYFDFIGEISKYFITLAISGTHGKSTSTALTIFTLSKICSNFGLGILGALVPEFENNNYLMNQAHTNQIKTIFDHIITGSYKNFNKELVKQLYFVIEADEFNRHFLKLDVDYATIHNIELDHSDCFKSEDEYYNVFKTFSNNVRHDIFGLKGEKLVEKLHLELQGKIQLLDTQEIEFKRLIGKHNQNNQTLIVALIKNICSQVDQSQIINILKEFKGLWRRTETIKTLNNGNILISDYGHHPTEIKTVLEAIKVKYPDKNIISIFQPHQARRVIEFWDQFVNTLKIADENYIYDIYTARENIQELLTNINNKDIYGIENVDQLGKLLCKKIDGEYIDDFERIEEIIKKGKNNSIIIYFSAGNLDFKIRNSQIIKSL